MPATEAILDLLACPDCDSAVRDGRCRCGALSPRPVDGFLDTLHGSSTCPEVEAFYEEQPFPDYEDLDSPRVLRARAVERPFLQFLDRHIPLGARVLEAGCGTGQLSHFLALSHRSVTGLDFCAASLRLAAAFRDRHRFHGAEFVRGDLLRAPLRHDSFDVVVSLGVLHHTNDPHGAFERLTALVKPGGLFVLGLYNRYGRIPNRLRRACIRLLPRKLASVIDPIARADRAADSRRHSWIRDQYFHPLESTHTVDEVLRWFDGAGLDYVHSVPNIAFQEPFEDSPFDPPGWRGSRLDRWLAQLGWMFSHGAEGGLFVMIGRKPQHSNGADHGPRQSLDAE